MGAPAAFAILAATLFAASNVASKRGLTSLDAVTGTLVSLPVALLVAAVAAARDLPSEVTARGMGFLCLSGLVAQGVGRLMAMEGVSRLGPSLHAPVQGSVYPALGAIGGALLLHESFAATRWLGVVGIIVGVWFLSFAPGRFPPRADPKAEQSAPAVRLTKASVVFPIVAGLSFGAGDILGKEAMADIQNPQFGAVVALSSALLTWVVFLAAAPRFRRRLAFHPAWGWFALHGILSSLAVILTFQALRQGDVSLVSPVIAAQPLIVLVLSWIFLTGIETITWTLVAGCSLTVLGTVIIVVS